MDEPSMFHKLQARIHTKDMSPRQYIFLLFLLLVPVLAALAWGPYFDDSVYSSLRYAQNLVFGRGLSHDAGIIGLDPPQSAITIGLLTLSTLLGSPSQLILSLSVLGWGVAAIIIYLTLRPLNSTVAALTAILIVFSPMVTRTLASPVSWAVATGWLVITLSIRSQNGRLVLGLMLLLLIFWFDLSVLALLTLLLFWRWRNNRQISRYGILVLVVFVLFLLVVRTLLFGQPFNIQLFTQLGVMFEPFRKTELAWLFLPFLVLGLVEGVIRPYITKSDLEVDPKRQPDYELPLYASFMVFWALIASLIGSALAPAVVHVAVLYLVALGLAWVQEWFANQGNPSVARYLTLGMAGLLLMVQLYVTWLNYLNRPVNRYKLEEQIVEWLQRQSDPDATLYASRRVGFLADRPTIPADPPTRDPEHLAAFFEKLSTSLPDYFITGDNIEWLALTQSGWIDDRYEPVVHFSSDYAPQEDLTIWAYRHTLFDEGESQATNVAVGDSLQLVAYQYEPTDIQPGDDVYLTLHLKATRPITVGFTTDVQLRYMKDGHIWAWREHLTPSSISGQYWKPGQILAERIRLQIEDNIPLGAYELQVLWRWPDQSEERWRLYQDNDPNPLDRLRLGYVTAPPPVDANLAEPIGATFGDQIRLSGINVDREQEPGDEVALSLFWEALRVPDNRYTVFVHLLNAAGDLVASHDGEPVDGTYPTAAWQPGPLIQDTRQLSLPADLPPGEYDLRVGFYLLETGERLPVVGAEGEAYPDHALPLSTLKVVP